MPRWLMKTADDTYAVWSTIVDEFMSDPMSREEAVEEHGEERVRFTDQHLCSCHARLGETIEVRNGCAVALGGGDLAYHFDNYDQVADFCRPYAERAAEAEAEDASA